MKMGIRSKFFLIFLSLSMIIVIIMLLFTRWSIHKGFTAYVEDRQARRIETISERLLEHYERDNGWHDLAGNRQTWVRLLFGFERRFPDHEPRRDDIDPGRGHGEHGHRRPMPYRLLLREGGDNWPSDRILRKLQSEAPRLPFEVRFMLFDENRQPIHGRTDQLPNSDIYPLVSEQKTIGYLALIRGPSLTDIGQLRFIAQQHTGLVWIGLGIILLSALISIYLAHRLVTPVQRFRKTAHELASGDYQSRVSVDRNDELGELAQDINQLAKSLQAHERARKQWVADIAHELRTPLSVIQGELEALQSGIRNLNPAAINSLHEDALRLGRLIDDLYDLSITDLGAMSYRKEKAHINDILLEDIDSMRDAYEKAGITIEDDLHATNAVLLWADSQRLSQLFRNILGNSLRYTQPPGRLKVKTSLHDDHLLISFMDSAPGVPEDALPQLFDRLYRAEYSRSRHTGGAGLGLAIARNIALAHDGEITAMPSELGGVCIQVKLSGFAKE